MCKRSKIWKIDRKEFQSLLNNSNSYSDVLRKLNYNTTNGGGYKILIQRIKEENLDTTSLSENRKKYQKEHIKNLTTIKNLNEILIENSTYCRRILKKRLIKESLLENKCSECGLTSIWNNKPISLQLDHINGVNNDNRLENLRILCPNCHSQTKTFSGKNNKIKNNCKKCRKNIHRKSLYCKKCSSILKNFKNRKFEVSKDKLINLIKQYPMTQVGKLLGVSDNAIRKRCRSLGIDYKNL